MSLDANTARQPDGAGGGDWGTEGSAGKQFSEVGAVGCLPFQLLLTPSPPPHSHPVLTGRDLF